MSHIESLIVVIRTKPKYFKKLEFLSQSNFERLKQKLRLTMYISLFLIFQIKP